MEPTVNVNEVSRISTGTVVKGEISSSNDIRIDGTFEGKIKSKGRVVVGEKALIKGDKVKGDLHIKRLQVELDAKFDGTCQMITESDFDRLVGNPAAAAQKPAAAPQPVQPK